MQKRKLIFVGEPNLPVYEMINSSSEFVKNHEVFIIPFSTFHNSILKYLDQDANIVFIGCNYKRVIEFFSYIFDNKDLISKILFFKEVSMLLCDSVKSFWMEFAINNISLFNKLYLLDMPNRHPIFTDNIQFKPIIGLPILQYINNFTFNKSKINILSFAGSIQVYPERKNFLDTLISLKLPITFHHDKYFSSNIDQYANVSYNIYIENLMDSLFTINFPRSTSHSFSQFQIKGRYWEALATGTTIIEEFNPLLNYFDYSPKIYNYNLLNDIVTYLHTQLDIGINNLYDDKISSYLNNKHLFEPDNFFDQFY